jgi:predicted TIM-barrel fold metal-dependent hydrolase
MLLRKDSNGDITMIIDGHSHAFGEFGYTDKLIPLMDKIGVDKVVLCPSGTEPDVEFVVPKIAYRKASMIPFFHIISNILFLRGQIKHMPVVDDDYVYNDYVYSMVKEFPDRLIQYFWTDPNDPKLLDTLSKNYEKMSFSGIKLHQCLTKFSNKDESMKTISKFAIEKNIPIFIHLYNFKEIRRFVKLAREFPKANYIVAHMMGFESIARRGKDLKNVYFDISTYFIVSNRRIKRAMKIFGDDKILLGSDSPIGDRCLELNIEKVRKMDITKKQKDKILGENLAKLLNLK